MKLPQNEKLKEVLKNHRYMNFIPSEILSEIIQKPYFPNYYPLGTTSFFIYYLSQQKFIYTDDNIETIYHIPAKDIIEMDSVTLFSTSLSFLIWKRLVKSLQNHMKSVNNTKGRITLL